MSAKTRSYKLASLTLAAGLPLLALAACGRNLDPAGQVSASPAESTKRLSRTLPQNANMRLVAERIDAAIANEMIADGKVNISARKLTADYYDNPSLPNYKITDHLTQKLMVAALKEATGKKLDVEHLNGVFRSLFAKTATIDAAKAIARGLAFHPDNQSDFKRMHNHVLNLLSELRTDSADEIQMSSGAVDIKLDDDFGETRRSEYFVFLNKSSGVFVQILTVEGR